MKQPFDHCACDYARHRPGYPSALFETLIGETGTPGGQLAVDVGAGTGIFTRALRDLGFRALAVDPSTGMLEQLGRHPGGFRLSGTAEHLPLRDGCADVVTAAQAFHWFNPPIALREIARVLRPGRPLMLCWNNRDPQRSVFVRDFEALITEHNPAYVCEYRRQDWAAKIEECAAFDTARQIHVDHDWTVPAEKLIGFCRSVSYLRNVLSRENMLRFEQDLLQLARRHFGDSPCRIPLCCEGWLCRRRSRAYP